MSINLRGIWDQSMTILSGEHGACQERVRQVLEGCRGTLSHVKGLGFRFLNPKP